MTSRLIFFFLSTLVSFVGFGQGNRPVSPMRVPSFSDVPVSPNSQYERGTSLKWQDPAGIERTIIHTGNQAAQPINTATQTALGAKADTAAVYTKQKTDELLADIVLDSGTGDMNRVTYDADADNVVDAAASVPSSGITGTVPWTRLPQGDLDALNDGITGLVPDAAAVHDFVGGVLGALPTVANTGQFADLVAKPTTVAGYGITDLYTKSQLDGGQLDNRYFTENEVTSSLALKLNANDASVTNTRTPSDGTVTDSKISGTLSQSKITNLVSDLAAKQPLNANLTTIGGLSASNDDFIQRKAGVWTNRTLANVKVDLGISAVENTALSTWGGSVNLTTLGTITTGTWNATTIAPTKGGTGLTTYTPGDLLYSNATNSLGVLAGNASTTRKFLSQTGNGTTVTAMGWLPLVAADIPALPISATTGLQAALDAAVLLTGNQTVAGIKTFPSTIGGSINGNAATATVFQTARTINGVSFDGSANITVVDATKQPLNSSLTDIGGLTPANDDIIQRKAGSWVSRTVAQHLSDLNLGAVYYTEAEVDALLSGKSSTAHTHILDGLSDVVISTPSTGQVLKFNGSNWVNDTDATGGGGGATNLTGTPAPTTYTVNSDTGTDIAIPAADNTNAGLLLPAEKLKITNTSGTNTGDQTITLTGAVTGSGTGSLATSITNDAITTTKILDGNVTLPKIANQASSTILGNNLGGNGPPLALTAAQVKALLAIAFNDIAGAIAAAQLPALTGDVTTPGGSVSTTIANNVVTNGKAADMATATFKGRNTAGTGDPEDLSISIAKAMLNLTGTNSGDQVSIVGITGTKAQYNTSVTDGDFLFVNDVVSFTDEAVDDRVGALIQNGTGIGWTYNDGANTLTPAVTLSPFSTTNLGEGTSLYFTDERAQDALGSIWSDTPTIDVTYNDAGNAISAAVIDNTSTQKIIVAKAGTTTGTRQKINFIEGANVTITTADNSGSDRVDVTIAATGGGGGSGDMTKAVYDANTNNTVDNSEQLGGVAASSYALSSTVPALTNVVEYTTAATNTYTVPTGAVSLEIVLVGGGGGGGSGRKSSSITATGGGGGGSGAALSIMNFSVSALGNPSTITIITGAGAVGGAAQSATNTNGNNGGQGVESSAAVSGNIILRAIGGFGGGGGTTAGGTGGAAGGLGMYLSTAGGTGGATAAGTTPTLNGLAAGSGGGGGGLNGSGTVQAFGSGSAAWMNLSLGATTSGAAPATIVGGRLTNGGAAGGAAVSGGNATAGGAGNRGSGGGGGGATVISGDSGAGGNGGAGYARVTASF